MGIIYNQNIVTDNLVLYLDATNRRSYPGAGTTWTDLSGNTNNAILTNGPTYDSGNGGNIIFDGIDDSVNLTYDLRQNFTFECWVVHNAINSFAFLGQGSGGQSSGLHIWFLETASTLRFGMYSNDTDVSIATSTGIWYHYCFTYNHSTYLKQIYRNGIQLNGNPLQTQTAYVGTGTLRIGATYSSGGGYANGKFAVSKLYNRVLSASEIKQNYNVLRRRYGL